MDWEKTVSLQIFVVDSVTTASLPKKQFPKLLSLRKNNAITSSFGGAIITSFLFQALNNTARKITASNHLFVLTIN